ncbi:MAG: hypothetical protein QOG72_1756 [Sphingomonadales bacterium]|jgi:RHS repeat-associated protein|nr:hypothetical protein [Sphingomonadales bacterium]
MDSADFGSILPGACTLTSPAGGFGPDRIARTFYDAAGRVSQVRTALGVTGEEANEVTATYTSNGRVETMTDAESNKTTFEYDGHDRLAKTRYPDTTKGAGTSSATDYEQPTYESLAGGTRTSGLVVAFRNRAGETTGFGYDALGRMTSKDAPGSEPDIAYSYDLLGRMTGASQTGTSLTFAWDALGRNLSQTGASGSYASRYDLAGRRTRLTHPDGFYVDQEYLVTGEMTAIRENGASSGVGVLATFAYDQLGRRTSVTYGNGETTGYQYDAVSRLSQLDLNLGGSANDLTLTFAYSPASQIVSTVRSNDLYAWTGHGNGSMSSTADGLNRMTAQGNTAYTYDSRGNMTTDGIKTYAFDSENKFLGVATAPLHYDPLNRLDGAGSPPAIYYENYVDRLIAERRTISSAVLYRHVFGPGADEPLVWYNGPGTSDRRFLHADERGSIVAVTSGSGALLAINRYDEYGKTETSDINYRPRFLYTGQRYFAGFDLYHYKNRAYDPKSGGRFMQPDPIGYGGGMNFYPYVGGDPVNLVDPLGLDKGDIEICYGVNYNGECMSYGSFYQLFQNLTVAGASFNNTDVNSGGGGGGGGGALDPKEAKCDAALRAAGQDRSAIARAIAAWGMLEKAAGNLITPRLLAAIGVRESGFRNVGEVGGGGGRGVFQITGNGIADAQAFDIAWSARWAATKLNANFNAIKSRFPSLNNVQLTQATAAAYNIGLDDISGNPTTIDQGTTGNNYGKNVIVIGGTCFPHS